MNKRGNMQQLAFVTGGSGFVGGRLIEALVVQGWQVRALVRGQKAAASVATLGAVPVLCVSQPAFRYQEVGLW